MQQLQAQVEGEQKLQVEVENREKTILSMIAEKDSLVCSGLLPSLSLTSLWCEVPHCLSWVHAALTAPRGEAGG